MWRFWRRNDPWRELAWVFDAQTTCACCDMPAASLLSVAYRAPDMATDLDTQPNDALIHATGDILTEDFCILEPHRFIRAVLIFPLQDRPETMMFGVSASLSQTNFTNYIRTFDARAHDLHSPLSGWLCNALPLHSDTPVPLLIYLQPVPARPKLTIADPDHPLHALQTNGLSPDHLTHILRACGHLPAAT